MLPIPDISTDVSARAAQRLLGREHPLAHAEERIGWLRRQTLVVIVLLVGGGVAVVAGASELRFVVIAAAIVQAVLLVALMSAKGARRHSAVDLIADGRATLPLAAVQRERSRLLDPRRLRALATSLDELRREARRPARMHPLHRTLYVRSVIRQVDDELAQTAELLRDGDPEPSAVARIERLLGGALSPLYGEDGRRLREELNRIRFGLRGRRS